MTQKRKPQRTITNEEDAAIQRGIAHDPDNPEWTAEDFAQGQAVSRCVPRKALATSIDRARGRPRSASPKKQISIRLDAEVVDKFKATGKGWQARINKALRKRKSKAPPRPYLTSAQNRWMRVQASSSISLDVA